MEVSAPPKNSVFAISSSSFRTLSIFMVAFVAILRVAPLRGSTPTAPPSRWRSARKRRRRHGCPTGRGARTRSAWVQTSRKSSFQLRRERQPVRFLAAVDSVSTQTRAVQSPSVSSALFDDSAERHLKCGICLQIGPKPRPDPWSGWRPRARPGELAGDAADLLSVSGPVGVGCAVEKLGDPRQRDRVDDVFDATLNFVVHLK